MIEKVGGSADELKKFKGFRKLAMEAIQQKGARDVRCPWQDFERTLEFEERAAMSIMYLEEEFVPMDEYLEEFGNPANNGHNHAPFTLDGKSGMLVPTSKRVRFQRKKDQSVIKKQILDDSSQVQLGVGQIDGKFEDLTMGFFNMFRATGTCMDKILPKVGNAAGGPAQGVWGSWQRRGFTEQRFRWRRRGGFRVFFLRVVACRVRSCAHT